jgi:hypothetical protein
MKKRTPWVIGIFLLSATLSAQTAEPVGMVVAVQGHAMATTSDEAARELHLSSDIFLNDSIETGPSSRIQLLLNDDSLIAQGESSEMTIDEYIYNPDQPSENAFGAKLGKGFFRTITGKITDLNPDRFSVRTSRANIGIRGCDLGFEITPSEDRISVIVIPTGKQIFVNPLTGLESLVIETPTYVTVDDGGAITQRLLNETDQMRVQRGTTPGAQLLKPQSGESSSLDAGLFGGESLLEQGSIIQDTLQGDLDHHDFH